MKNKIYVALLIVLLCSPALAQDLPEYGDISELKTFTKVYVHADDADSRDYMLTLLKKDKSFEIVNNPDDAEFMLVYSIKSSTESRGLQTSHYMRSNLMAYVTTEKGRKRILWTEDETWDARGGFTFTAPNEYNLTKHFIKAIKKLRGVKK